MKSILTPILLFISLIFVFLSFFAYIPIPDGVEDPEVLRVASPVYAFAFYSGVINWYLGYDVEGIFYPAKFLIQLLRFRNTHEDFQDVNSAYEMMDKVEVKSYIPRKQLENKEASSAIIFLHGGGYTLGHPESYNFLTSNISSTLEVPVFAVNYRKAPQGKYPVPIHEVASVVKFLMKYHGKYNIDINSISIVGDSAGAHLAISTALMLLNDEQKKSSFKFKSMALIYPATQMLTANTPSYLKYKDDMILSRFTTNAFRLNFVVGKLDDILVLNANNHTNKEIRQHYASKFDLPLLMHKGPQDLDGGGLEWAIEKYRFTYEDWLISPLFAPSRLLKNFPPTYLQICEFDVLRDEGIMFAYRLKQLGVKVQFDKYKSIHGMYSFIQKGHTPGIKAMKDLISYLQMQTSLSEQTDKLILENSSWECIILSCKFSDY